MDNAETLRQAILDQLRSRQWRAGHRLPTERDLGEQYGLSRSTVRRVLQDFKRKQLITQTVGSGTYVADNVQQTLGEMASLGPAQVTSPSELMSARLVLEPAIIDMVIGNATGADFQRMDDLQRARRGGPDAGRLRALGRRAARGDRRGGAQQLHPLVFRLMNEVRSQAEWGVLKRRSATPERRLDYQQEHRALVAALRERDASAPRPCAWPTWCMCAPTCWAIDLQPRRAYVSATLTGARVTATLGRLATKIQPIQPNLRWRRS
jgi:DNA-binding FadR family transcriptional regulator